MIKPIQLQTIDFEFMIVDLTIFLIQIFWNLETRKKSGYYLLLSTKNRCTFLQLKIDNFILQQSNWIILFMFYTRNVPTEKVHTASATDLCVLINKNNNTNEYEYVKIPWLYGRWTAACVTLALHRRRVHLLLFTFKTFYFPMHAARPLHANSDRFLYSRHAFLLLLLLLHFHCINSLPFMNAWLNECKYCVNFDRLINYMKWWEIVGAQESIKSAAEAIVVSSSFDFVTDTSGFRPSVRLQLTNSCHSQFQNYNSWTCDCIEVPYNGLQRTWWFVPVNNKLVRTPIETKNTFVLSLSVSGYFRVGESWLPREWFPR